MVPLQQYISTQAENNDNYFSYWTETKIVVPKLILH